MNSSETFIQLTNIFKNVLRNPGLDLRRDSDINNTPGWDSFNHIRIILAIEKHFGVKFTTSEIQSWNNVGDLTDTLEKKLV